MSETDVAGLLSSMTRSHAYEAHPRFQLFSAEWATCERLRVGEFRGLHANPSLLLENKNHLNCKMAHMICQL